MYEEPISKLIEFLRTEFGSAFKEYYDGDPDEIPTSNLPCIVVIKLNDRMTNGPTGMQRVEEQLEVKVIHNKRDDWTAKIETTQLTEKKIRDVVEGRDSATGAYKPTTLKHAILNRFTMDGGEINQEMTFELGVLPRTEELITQEGHLGLTVTYLVPNPRH